MVMVIVMMMMVMVVVVVWAGRTARWPPRWVAKGIGGRAASGSASTRGTSACSAPDGIPTGCPAEEL